MDAYLAAHLKVEHGWPWRRLMRAYAAEAKGTQRDAKWAIEHAIIRMYPQEAPDHVPGSALDAWRPDR